MAKQKRLAFGILEDGLVLKLANLSRDGNQMTLHALEQVELNQSLHLASSDKTSEIDSKLNGWDLDKAPSGEINLNDITDDESIYQGQPYEALFRTYSLERGVIAISTHEEQIIKLPIANPTLSNKQKLKLVKESIPKIEFKRGKWQTSVVSINEQPELWIHHGSNKLMDILEKTSVSDKLKYYYQLADANDTALANLFLQTNPPESTDTSMVLYLGNEYLRALVFDCNKWTFSLPIRVTQHIPDIEIIYSKLSLAMDESHIPDPNNLYLCGDFCNDDSLTYLSSQLPNTKVGKWKLSTLNIDPEITDTWNETQTAKFILAIALAWKALTMDQPAFLKTNFLPPYIIEGQKVFKIAWHGYLTLALLFISALSFTYGLQKLRRDVKNANDKNAMLQKEHEEKKKAAETMLSMANAIDIQTANIEVIKTLLTNKNPWTEILTKLNSSFQSHPISWLKNLRKDGTGFKVTGVTTHRPNIVVFSNLFPKGAIVKVFHRKIRSFTVWEFEINYEYPDVNWYEMMEKDVEQLRKYQEEKTEKTGLVTLQDEKVIPAESTKDKALGLITKKTEQLKQAVIPKTSDTVVTQSAVIDIPYPPKNLIAETDNPMVKAYIAIITAFNQKSDWQMIDLGVKFNNNYPNSPLGGYVRWYLAYRAMHNKQYDKADIWLEPLFKNKDSIYPYVLLLAGKIRYDNGDIERAEFFWRQLVQDYPQHQTGKTARKLMGY